MNIFLGVLLGILVLTVVVTVHEFGHFILAKRNGVKVNEFGIGFPPKAKTWLHVPAKEVAKYCRKFKFDDVRAKKLEEKATKKLAKQKRGQKKWMWIPLPKDEWYEETEEGLVPKAQNYLIFSLNWLPIGGFCQMDGESNTDTKKGTFGASSFWSKTKILFAGVAMNWLFAFIVLTVLAWIGMPELFENQYRVANDTYYTSEGKVSVEEVFDNSPAKEAGITHFDQILELKSGEESKVVHSASDLQEFNQAHKGETVTYKIRHWDDKKPDGPTEYETEVKLNPDGAEYTLGISMSQAGKTAYRTTWSAPIVGAVTTIQITGETFRGLGTLVYNIFSGIGDQLNPDSAVREAGKTKIGAAGDSVTGPVGIVGVLFPAIAQTGIENVLFLIALISVSLACMNVLPIPALDGGRWLLIAIFRALKRPLSPGTEAKIVSRTFVLLLVLAAIITILDVVKIVR